MRLNHTIICCTILHEVFRLAKSHTNQMTISSITERTGIDIAISFATFLSNMLSSVTVV